MSFSTRMMNSFNDSPDCAAATRALLWTEAGTVTFNALVGRTSFKATGESWCCCLHDGEAPLLICLGVANCGPDESTKPGRADRQ